LIVYHSKNDGHLKIQRFGKMGNQLTSNTVIQQAAPPYRFLNKISKIYSLNGHIQLKLSQTGYSADTLWTTEYPRKCLLDDNNDPPCSVETLISELLYKKLVADCLADPTLNTQMKKLDWIMSNDTIRKIKSLLSYVVACRIVGAEPVYPPQPINRNVIDQWQNSLLAGETPLDPNSEDPTVKVAITIRAFKKIWPVLKNYDVLPDLKKILQMTTPLHVMANMDTARMMAK
jgi:hypothetical protein